MCVIAYAAPGVDILDETIKKMFEHNHDGAGIMWKPLDGGDIMIRKGFMKVEDLIRAWDEIPIECEKAIHCRIATSGKVSAECCHPFPVRPYTAQMKLSSDHAPLVIMHNGVFSFCSPKGGLSCDYSDTMKFAADYIYPLRDNLDNPVIQDLLERISSSRLLILRTNGEAIRLGSWEEKDGVYYSNLNHEPRQYFYNTGFGLSSYNSTYTDPDGRKYTTSGYDVLTRKYTSTLTEGTYSSWNEMHEAEKKYWDEKESKPTAEDTISKEDELSLQYEEREAQEECVYDGDTYEYKVTVDVSGYLRDIEEEYLQDRRMYSDSDGDADAPPDKELMEEIALDTQYALLTEFEAMQDNSPNIGLYADGEPFVDLENGTATFYVWSNIKYRNKTVKRFFSYFDVVGVSRVSDSEPVPQVAETIEKVA